MPSGSLRWETATKASELYLGSSLVRTMDNTYPQPGSSYLFSLLGKRGHIRLCGWSSIDALRKEKCVIVCILSMLICTVSAYALGRTHLNAIRHFSTFILHNERHHSIQQMFGKHPLNGKHRNKQRWMSWMWPLPSWFGYWVLYCSSLGRTLSLSLKIKCFLEAESLLYNI